MTSSVEIYSTTGIHLYSIDASKPNTDEIIYFRDLTLLGAELRYNVKENRVEFLTEDGNWDVYISDSEIFEVELVR